MTKAQLTQFMWIIRLNSFGVCYSSESQAIRHYKDADIEYRFGLVISTFGNNHQNDILMEVDGTKTTCQMFHCDTRT